MRPAALQPTHEGTGSGECAVHDMTSTRFAAALGATAIWFSTLAIAPAPHPYGFADWQNLPSATPVAVAPDGKTILYSVAFGQQKGATKTEWITIRADGSGRTKLRVPKGFHPNGFTTNAHEIYGAQSTRDDIDQLALWTVGAKKAHVISRVPGGIGQALISPDGTRFAVTGDPRPPDPMSTVRTVVGNAPTALYVLRADGSHGAWWCPGHDQVSGFAWSHDGTRIALLQQTPKLGYHHVSGAIDICTATSAQHVASIDNAVANEIPYAGSGIAWTDGDATLAFLSTTTNVITPDHLWTVPAAGGTPVDRTPHIPFSILSLRGDAHGHLWTSVAAGVQTNVVEYRGGKRDRTFSNGNFVGMPAVADLTSAPELLAFGVATTTHPGELAVGTASGLRTITHESDAQLTNVAFGKVIRHRWTSADGTHLEAIVTFPPNWNGKPGKFLVLPHGGPEANDELRIDAFSRIIASHGFVVMQPEYRGSTGYGSAHLQAIYQHFGDTAYRDVDAATTEAIAQGWANPKRLAIFGWSAGGFMTSWTVTQTSRYKAAIEGAGITEWLSFIMSSDVQQTDYDARELSDGPEPFLKYSAVMFTKNVTTPLLILHGGSDVRVPTYQGRELFALLKEEGKTVRMVTYPGSPHFPVLWEQRRNVFDEVLHWLDRYDP
jgi:dipeptidyl aminopeptidase/acylaminoacyl peptidase